MAIESASPVMQNLKSLPKNRPKTHKTTAPIQNRLRPNESRSKISFIIFILLSYYVFGLIFQKKKRLLHCVWLLF
jgi:hypothetical protein